jgi:hypothetical protein
VYRPNKNAAKPHILGARKDYIFNISETNNAMMTFSTKMESMVPRIEVDTHVG